MGKIVMAYSMLKYCSRYAKNGTVGISAIIQDASINIQGTDE
jgi:hypothetical protein